MMILQPRVGSCPYREPHPITNGLRSIGCQEVADKGARGELIGYFCTCKLSPRLPTYVDLYLRQELRLAIISILQGTARHYRCCVPGAPDDEADWIRPDLGRI